MRAALGFRAHTGWAAAVAVAGPVSAPKVLHRRRIELSDGPDVEAAQVYHIAAERPLAEASRLIDDARALAERKAREGLETAGAELRAAGHELVAIGVVLGNGRLPAELASILRSHPLIHTAEGDLYRAALVSAGEASSLRVTGVAGGELYDRAAERLGRDVDRLRRDLADLGRPIGKPWAQDQKESTLLAWMALAAR